VRISEIMGGAGEPPRRVGIRFDRRVDAMQSAVRLYRELGVDTIIEQTTIFVECGPVIATHYLGMMERATGVPGFNEWDRARARRA
jgi:hypothetical protein